MKLKHEIPPTLKRKLQELGWSIGRLAKEAGIEDQRLYANLRGDNQMSIETGLKLLEVLGYANEDEGQLLLTEMQEHYEKRQK